MKFLIILILALPIYLFSAQTDSYSEGLKYYKAKDFKNSYAIFKKIYLDNLSDIKFNFYFGRSAYETGHYEAALGAFERVEIQDGSNLRNRLEIARTYFMLKMYEDSENAFRDVLANPNVPENVRINIELSLARVSKVQKKSFTYATVSANILYDSNVNYGSISDYDYGGSTFNQVKEISDTALQIFANVVNIYDIGDKNDFAIKNSFSVFSKDYNDENSYDVLFYNYSPSLIYKETKYTTELVLGMDNMHLGSLKYLSSLYFMPKLEYSHTTTLRSIYYLKYQAKRFKQEAQYDLDANRFELSYSLQKILSPRSYLQGNIVGINESRLRGTNIYVNYGEYKLNTTYANQFSSNYSFDIYAQVRRRSYRDYSNGFGSFRTDIGGTGSIGVTMKIMPTLRVNLKTSYEYVDSNQDRFSYDKHVTTAGLIKTF